MNAHDKIIGKHLAEYEPVLTWRKRESLGDRTTYIGGSDAATIAGLNKYKSPYRLHMEKRGEMPRDPDLDFKAAIYLGRMLEPTVLALFEVASGIKVGFFDILESNGNNWIAAHPDAITYVDDKLAIIEAKTASAYLSDEWAEQGADGNETVPMQYAIQLHHNMMVAGAERGYMAVLIGGQDFRWYPFKADPDIQRNLFEMEERFWQGVQAGNPPPFDPDHEAAEAEAREMLKLAPLNEGEMVELPAALEAHHQILWTRKERENQLKDELKQSEKQAKAARAAILHFAAKTNAQFIVTNGGIDAWHITKNKQLRQKTFA